jgi:hypothetical protein
MVSEFLKACVLRFGNWSEMSNFAMFLFLTNLFLFCPNRSRHMHLAMVAGSDRSGFSLCCCCTTRRALGLDCMASGLCSTTVVVLLCLGYKLFRWGPWCHVWIDEDKQEFWCVYPCTSLWLLQPFFFFALVQLITESFCCLHWRLCLTLICLAT